MIKKFKWFEQPLRWANILLIGVTLLTYLMSYVNPVFAGWLSILGLTYPVLIIFHFIFLSFWLYRKKYKLALSTFICILIGWSYLTASFGTNYFSSIPKASENKLSIATYNVRNFRYEGNRDNKKRSNKVNKSLTIYNDLKLDIFCGQEFRYPDRQEAFTNEMNTVLGNPKYFATNKKGLVIFSKYPIINSGEIQTPDDDILKNASLFADVQINNNFIIRVYSVHLESNKVSKTTESIELDADKLQTKSTWRTIYNVLGAIKNNQKLRAEQIKKIVEHIEGSPYPTILCGDFNDTPLSYTFRQANNVLQDNFTERAKGKGTTYNGNIPFLRIDYILSDNRFNVIDTKILREYNSSDHFPMYSTISWEF